MGLRSDSKKEIGAFRYGDVPVADHIDDFFDYTKALLRTALNAQEMTHLHSDDWQRTIYIDTLGVSTADFGISAEKRDALVVSGRECAQKYFDWFTNAVGPAAPRNKVLA